MGTSIPKYIKREIPWGPLFRNRMGTSIPKQEHGPLYRNRFYMGPENNIRDPYSEIKTAMDPYFETKPSCCSCLQQCLAVFVTLRTMLPVSKDQFQVNVSRSSMKTQIAIGPVSAAWSISKYMTNQTMML